MRQCTLVIATALTLATTPPTVVGGQPRADPGDRVVLVTLDGARTEEIFQGLDPDVLRSTLKEGQKIEDAPAYRKFWAESPDDRRRKLMPFLWSLVTEHGSIAGDSRLGSVVQLANTHWFSYPGYAEILLGQAHDQEIKSNDPVQNRYSTVLETLRARLGLSPPQVATFASWAVFNQIAERSPGATLVNAGVEPLDLAGDEVRVLNRLQAETTTPWDGTRYDAYTFRLAMAHLVAARPRVLYLAFDETDDWAHDGRYDRVLESYARTDGYLRELWMWLQSQTDYRGRTHLLITTDHGRGRTLADWRDHGAKVPGAGDVWVAFVSPRMPQRGPWQRSPALSTSQFAATLASWMGVDWTAEHPQAGKAVR